MVRWILNYGARATGAARGGDRRLWRPGTGDAAAVVSPAGPARRARHVGRQHCRAAWRGAVIAVVSPDQPGRGRPHNPEARWSAADLRGGAGDDRGDAGLPGRPGALAQLRLQAAPPRTQNLAQCGWLSGTAPAAPARLPPKSQSGSYGSRVQATTLGFAAPFR